MLVCEWPRLSLESSFESATFSVGSGGCVSAVANVPDFGGSSDEAMGWWKARVMVRWWSAREWNVGGFDGMGVNTQLSDVLLPASGATAIWR